MIKAILDSGSSESKTIFKVIQQKKKDIKDRELKKINIIDIFLLFELYFTGFSIKI